MAQRPNPTLACRRQRVLVAGPWALALLLSAGPTLAAPTTKSKAKDLLPAAAGQPSQRNRANAPGEVHRLTAQLNALGAVSCLARAEQIARFLDQSNVATVAVMPLATYPNQRLVTANLAIPQADGSEALAIVTLAPNQANDCGASYQMIRSEPGSCVAALKARQAEPQGAVPLGSKKTLIQRLSQDTVFLGWQLKDTCVIVKQQSILN
jgi:hypothetical protein